MHCLTTPLIIEQFPRNIIQDKRRVDHSDRALVQTNKHTGLILVYIYSNREVIFFNFHEP